eukprot:TRINITY_DN23863_c1_g2_i2.p1 TRINITY_DN23863_c1_g2~~TRINITY_DN23863_c1_g2_i2.p1  ORF type:complete len:310 (-),score=53.12 TRINITY_DN23863_c1_g2_i2:1674-2603(-)
MAGSSKIAVVGYGGVGKKSLMKELVHLPELATETLWDIDTKYYSVQVQIQSFTLSPNGTSPPQLDDFEALILVYDLSVPNSLAQIQQYCESQNLDAYELRFVVGNKADLVPHNPQHVQHVSSWCGENLMEYVQTCAIDNEIDSEVIVDEEKSGIQYLERGLKAHMWQGLRLKSKPSDSQQQSTRNTILNQDEGDSQLLNDQENNLQIGNQEVQGQQVEVINGDDQSSEGEVDFGYTRLPGDEFEDEFVGQSQSQSIGPNMDQFERLLAEVSSARERFQGLPDDVRREAASQLAMRLAEAFGLDEEEIEE